MKYPAGRNFLASLPGFVVGSVFAAVGWFVAADAGVFFGSVFGGIGALVAVGTLYSMLNSLEVSRDANGIKTVRRILGIPVKRRHMGSHEFVMFKKDSRFQSQGAGKHVMHYSIYAVDRHGDKIVVGEGFKGDSQAEAAIRLIGDVLRLRSAPDPRSTRKSPESADNRSFQALT